MDASIELAVYRVVQKSLTNVTKHAGGADVEVVSSAPGRQVRTEKAPAGGNGLGPVGMRQRVELLGGSLAAGRRTDGGFEVSAVLPLRTA